MITHITVEDAANLISRIARINETHALTYIREAADRGEIQAANVAPVAHAQWKDVFQDGPCSWSGKCSRCRVRNDIPPLLLAHYCPNCGARMDGKEGNT